MSQKWNIVCSRKGLKLKNSLIKIKPLSRKILRKGRKQFTRWYHTREFHTWTCKGIKAFLNCSSWCAIFIFDGINYKLNYCNLISGENEIEILINNYLKLDNFFAYFFRNTLMKDLWKNDDKIPLLRSKVNSFQRVLYMNIDDIFICSDKLGDRNVLKIIDSYCGSL